MDEKTVGERMIDLMAESGLPYEECLRNATAVLVTTLVCGIGGDVAFEDQKALGDAMMAAAGKWAEEWKSRACPNPNCGKRIKADEQCWECPACGWHGDVVDLDDIRALAEAKKAEG